MTTFLTRGSGVPETAAGQPGGNGGGGGTHMCVCDAANAAFEMICPCHERDDCLMIGMGGASARSSGMRKCPSAPLMSQNGQSKHLLSSPLIWRRRERPAEQPYPRPQQPRSLCRGLALRDPVSQDNHLVPHPWELQTMVQSWSQFSSGNPVPSGSWIPEGEGSPDQRYRDTMITPRLRTLTNTGPECQTPCGFLLVSLLPTAYGLLDPNNNTLPAPRPCDWELHCACCSGQLGVRAPH
ncbi:unnamed protein product [Boreogadus saida]